MPLPRLLLLTILPLLGSLLTAAETAPTPTPATVPAAKPALILEALAGVRCTAEGLVVSTSTSGYTDKTSFQAIVLRDGETRNVTVSLARLVPDAGKMMPQPLELTWTLAELGLTRADRIRIGNPLAVLPGL